MTVSVVDVLHNFRGIEQNHDVVRESTDSVNMELFFRKQDRTGFRQRCSGESSRELTHPQNVVQKFHEVVDAG